MSGAACPALGIMQGRLSPPVNGRIQAFPADRWQDEIAIAPALGLEAIEWIAESPLAGNPLWTAGGVERIRERLSACGVRVDFICADYFLERPWLRTSSARLSRNRAVLTHLIRQCPAVGARGVEIPLLDAAAIGSPQEEDDVCRALEPCLDAAERSGVLVGLETSLAPDRFAALLARLDHPAVRVAYDTGNSAALGYDPAEEIDAYGQLVANVHIKDRVSGGTTVVLGEGDADLPRVFTLLRRSGYAGGYTLQAARGADEISIVRQYVAQVRGWLSRA